jgi:pyruvate kinase
MALVWGVYPLLTHFYGGTDEIIAESLSAAVQAGFLHNGELAAVTGGDAGSGTNLLKIQIISAILLQGTGIGPEPVQGTVKIVTQGEQAAAITDEHIVVCHSAGGLLPYLQAARGIIAEEGGLTGETAILGMQLRIPVVIGVKNAVTRLKDGMIITLDPKSGSIYLMDNLD